MRRLLFAVLLIGMGLLSGCGGDDNKKDNQNGGSTTPDTADLAVSNIELDPAQVSAGQSITIKVYVANNGSAASGAYDLEITQRDVTRGTSTLVGKLQGQTIQPGKEMLAYETGQRTMFEAGSFQIDVKLTPAGPDGELANNSKSRAFTVN